MKSSRGFTTIELLIVIAIMAILAAIAIPSYADFFEKNRVRGAAEMVYEQLMHAKTLSIKRSKPIIIEFSVDGTSPWAIGITDKVTGCVPDAATCTISDYDNDGSIDADGGLAMFFTDAKFKNVTVTQTFSDDDFSFEPLRGSVPDDSDGSTNAGTAILTSSSGNYVLQVVVSEAGHITTCSPTGKKIVGYPDCP